MTETTNTYNKSTAVTPAQSPAPSDPKHLQKPVSKISKILSDFAAFMFL